MDPRLVESSSRCRCPLSDLRLPLLPNQHSEEYQEPKLLGELSLRIRARFREEVRLPSCDASYFSSTRLIISRLLPSSSLVYPALHHPLHPWGLPRFSLCPRIEQSSLFLRSFRHGRSFDRPDRFSILLSFFLSLLLNLSIIYML